MAHRFGAVPRSSSTVTTGKPTRSAVVPRGAFSPSGVIADDVIRRVDAPAVAMSSWSRTTPRSPATKCRRGERAAKQRVARRTLTSRQPVCRRSTVWRWIDERRSRRWRDRRGRVVHGRSGRQREFADGSTRSGHSTGHDGPDTVTPITVGERRECGFRRDSCGVLRRRRCHRVAGPQVRLAAPASSAGLDAAADRGRSSSTCSMKWPAQSRPMPRPSSRRSGSTPGAIVSAGCGSGRSGLAGARRPADVDRPHAAGPGRVDRAGGDANLAAPTGRLARTI